MDHEVDIGHFDDPVGAHLEVIEIEAPLFLIKRLPLGRQTFDGQQVLPEFFVRTQPEAVTAVERRNLQIRIAGAGRCRNKRAGGLEECIVHIGRPHIAQGFQKDDVQLGHVVRPFIVRAQDVHIGRPVRNVAVLKDRADKGPQAVADPHAVLGRKAQPRLDDERQVMAEQDEIGDFLLGQGNAFGQLLRIAVIEIGYDRAHESRRIHADIPFPVGQELVEVFQGHHLLMLCHIRRIFPENADVRTHVFPVPFTPGGFDEIAKIAFAAENGHEAQVVIDGGIFQLGNDIVPFHEDPFAVDPFRRKERRLGEILRQVRNDAPFFHERFKVR